MDPYQPPRAAPLHVPILTEVIEVVDLVNPSPPASAQAASTSMAPHMVTLSEPTPSQSEWPVPPPVLDLPTFREAAMAPPLQPLLDEAQIAQRVLADVQRQIDGMLEYRLREALVPILGRLSETLVRDLRQELSRTMSDVVTRSVAQEVARQRPRN